MKEFKVERKINIIDDERGIRLGDFAIESIKITHSVPDGRHFYITSPHANIYHGSDFKFDLTPIDGVRPDFQKIANAGKRGVTVLLSDCLRSEKSGFSLSESSLNASLESEIRSSRGKVIVTTMSSSVHRIQQAVDAAAKAQKRIALFGRSVEVNSRVAQELNFLKLPTKAMVKKKKIRNIPDNQLALIVAGSQGQEGSALVRAARGEHREIEIKPGDKVIFSADPIPGNEKAVYETIDALVHLGAEVAYHDINDELHVSGHASEGDLMLLMELLRPKYLVPIGGTYRHMVQYRKLAAKMGYQEDNVFLLEEGQSLEVDLQRKIQVGKTIPLKNVMVDGLGIGDVGKVVLRDRQVLAEEGILVVIVPINAQSGKLTGDIEIISRGVVFMKESKELISKAKSEVYQTLKSFKPPITEWRSVKEKITTNLEKLLSKELERFPIIIPIILRM
jgi:ribonuclease J